MTPQAYSFSLLQYRHSAALGEVLNAGLLLHWQNGPSVHFLFPDKLLRLRLAYPQLAEKTLRTYLKFFERRAEELNRQPEIFAQYSLRNGPLNDFIAERFLTPDASALQFGETRRGITYLPKTEFLDSLYNQFFYLFETEAGTVGRMDDVRLLQQYKSLLHQIDTGRNLQDNDRYRINYVASIRDSKELRFDIAWKQNSTWHLVRPASFDLQERRSILRKAHQFYGQFLDPDVAGYAAREGCQYDLLLAPPRSSDLFKSYDEAVRLLQRPEHLRLIEQADLPQYSSQTVNALF